MRGQHARTCQWCGEAQEVSPRGWLSCLRGGEAREARPEGLVQLSVGQGGPGGLPEGPARPHLSLGQGGPGGRPEGWLSCLLSSLACRQRPLEVCPVLLPSPSPGPRQRAPGGQDRGHECRRHCVCEPSRWMGFAVSNQNPLYNWILGKQESDRQSPEANDRG